MIKKFYEEDPSGFWQGVGFVLILVGFVIWAVRGTP